MEGLTVGRIVHYINNSRKHNAAIVCDVLDKEQGLVNLCVFGATGEPYPKEIVMYALPEKNEYSTWHWIEKA